MHKLNLKPYFTLSITFLNYLTQRGTSNHILNNSRVYDFSEPKFIIIFKNNYEDEIDA